MDLLLIDLNQPISVLDDAIDPSSNNEVFKNSCGTLKQLFRFTRNLSTPFKIISLLGITAIKCIKEKN